MMGNDNSGRNRRQHIRTKLRTKIKLMHPELGDSIWSTGDISDGGVFLIADGKALPAMGDVVKIQVQNLPVEAPVVEARVVRVDSEGIGLEFVNP